MNKHIEDCAKILLERHNPDTDIDSDVGQRLMDGFVRDLECISHYYNITRKDKSSKIDWQNTLNNQLERLRTLPETRIINTIIEDLENLYELLIEKFFDIEIFPTKFDGGERLFLAAEDKTTLINKIMFYREQMDKLRKYISDNNIGKPCESIFDIIYTEIETVRQQNQKLNEQILNPVNQWYSELLTEKNKEIELLKEHIREWIKLIESASIYL